MPYDIAHELGECNADFADTDVSIVVLPTVNPSSLTTPPPIAAPVLRPGTRKPPALAGQGQRRLRRRGQPTPYKENTQKLLGGARGHEKSRRHVPPPALDAASHPELSSRRPPLVDGAGGASRPLERLVVAVAFCGATLLVAPPTRLGPPLVRDFARCARPSVCSSAAGPIPCVNVVEEAPARPVGRSCVGPSCSPPILSDAMEGAQVMPFSARALMASRSSRRRGLLGAFHARKSVHRRNMAALAAFARDAARREN